MDSDLKGIRWFVIRDRDRALLTKQTVWYITADGRTRFKMVNDRGVVTSAGASKFSASEGLEYPGSPFMEIYADPEEVGWAIACGMHEDLNVREGL